ncbi:hypothetical protein [Ralstonia solanacearum]|uniref:hypothetical protein n=1 Tax=Ralstonia solanacearum TaxID=305 RepID=UPI0001D96A92|nr:hypothetical protein [Ralstonia solanacearum]CBJ34814.1 hypothethical protein [Ralstonia solanacearum PSI07]
MIENVVEVFDNGVDLEYGLSYEAREALKLNTGAKFPVATRWTYYGHVYEDANCPKPIPDMSGLVYATQGWKTWVVLNPNGTQRFVIQVPRISEKSVPDQGDLGEPLPLKGGAMHVMYGEGGDGERHDCRFYFNMHTGELMKVDFVGRHW